MKLYLIAQEFNNDYDTYSDAVVAAESEEDAKTIHPSGNGTVVSKKPEEWPTWATLEHIQVKYIGETTEGIERGVICASFHAG